MQSAPDPPLAAFLDYLEAYLGRRDFAATEACLARDCTVLGTGVDEWGRDREESLALFRRDLEQAPEPIRWECPEVRCRSLGPGVALVECLVNLTAEVGGQPWIAHLRESAVMVQEGEAWRLAHKHISFPAPDQQSGEAYPLEALEARNRYLEGVVADRTRELLERNAELQAALASVRTLRGLVPVCAWCRKVRDDAGFWLQVDQYLQQHADASVTHGICPDCAERIKRMDSA